MNVPEGSTAALDVGMEPVDYTWKHGVPYPNYSAEQLAAVQRQSDAYKVAFEAERKHNCELQAKIDAASAALKVKP
jgi:hypothetical protein